MGGRGSKVGGNGWRRVEVGGREIRVVEVVRGGKKRVGRNRWEKIGGG